MTGWSDEAMERTIDGVAYLAAVPARHGVLCFKHANGGFATMREGDLLAGMLRLNRRDGGADILFENVHELIRAGWVLD